MLRRPVIVALAKHCRRRIAVVNQVLVPPSFRTFSAKLLLQTLRSLPVIMLVTRLIWRNKFLMFSHLTFFVGREETRF